MPAVLALFPPLEVLQIEVCLCQGASFFGLKKLEVRILNKLFRRRFSCALGVLHRNGSGGRLFASDDAGVWSQLLALAVNDKVLGEDGFGF